MKIPCFRCGKELDSPDVSNANYVIAPDTIVKERPQFYIAEQKTAAEIDAEKAELDRALSVLRATLISGVLPTGSYLSLDDVPEEIEAIETELAIGVSSTKQVLKHGRLQQVQKTGIICPDCLKPTDTIIWGIQEKE